MNSGDLWVMLTAALCAASCGLLGCFLVLRRMSLLGDAISHAILPGLAVAFLLSDSRHPLPMLAGAMAVGVLTAVITAVLNRWGRVPEDAAMGVTFSMLFAIGVLLITWVAHDIDLDPGCVLYGLLEMTAVDTVSIGGLEVPRAAIWLGSMLLLNVVLVTVFFKELRIVCFDPYLATTMGISAALVHYGLMSLVAATSVASFESVGSILVVAMLVAPGATAQLLTDRLGRMLWLAVALGVSASIIGHLLAIRWNTSIAGMISVAAGAQFLLAVVAAPRYGVLSRLIRNVRLSLRIEREDVLGILYRASERGRDAAEPLAVHEIVRAMPGSRYARLAVWTLLRSGLLRKERNGLELSEAGREIARDVVRGHRLWESFLAKHTALPLDHLHEPSHRVEHFVRGPLAAEVSADVAAERDPHGKPIP